MHFSTFLGDLTDALNTVAIAVRPRPPLPVLGGVLVGLADGRVTLSAFDYETSVSVALDATVTGAGRFLVSHADLLKLCRGAAKGDAVKVWRGHPTALSAQDGQVTLSVAGFELPLDSLPVEDYPTLPAPGKDMVASLDIGRDRLVDELKRLCVSAGTDDTVPVLRQVNLELRDGVLAAATTDRFQLGAARIPVNTESDQAGPWNLSASTLHKVAKLLPAGLVTVQFPDSNTGWVTVLNGSVTATLRMFDGDFPRYRQIFPTPQHTAVADRSELLRAVVKAEALTVGRVGTMRLELRPGTLTLAPGTDSEGRRAVGRTVSAETDIAHGHLEFGFNPTYLRAAVEQITGDQIAIGLTPGRRPALFAADVDDLSSHNGPYLHLVMPVTLPEPAAAPKVPAPRVVTETPVGSAL